MLLTLTPDPLDARLQRLRTQLAGLRRDYVHRLARQALTDVVALTPVDTARTRTSWVTPLIHIGGLPPPGWRGPHPDPAAIEEGARLGSSAESYTQHTSTFAATSAVPYVNYIEYGTRRMPPFLPVRQSLHHLRQRLNTIPFLPNQIP